MRLNFRQGLVSYQQDVGVATFLRPSTTPGFVSHTVSPTPTIITAAHGSSDYLIKIDTTVDLAWQITGSATTYLFWDVDLLTAQVSRGTTVIAPVNSLTEPQSPADGLHWFDMTDTVTKVWHAASNRWNPKIRVFAGVVLNGNLNSITAYTAGSQAGLNVPSNPGYIMLDNMLQPLRKASLYGEFLTDASSAHVQTSAGTSGVLVQPVSRVVAVRAGEPIPKMSMVYFSDEDTVRLATSDPGAIPARPPVGICLDDIDVNQVGSLTISGEVSHDQWDWGANIGDAVYCSSTGQLTLTRPLGLMAYRVGFIKNRNTILINVDSETSPTIYSVGANDLIIAGQAPVVVNDVTNGIGERVVTIGVPNSSPTENGLMTAAQYASLNTLGARVTDVELALDAKADINHSHAISSITGLQLALDGKAAVVHNHDAAYASLVHTHTAASISDLSSILNGYALRTHLTAVSEVYTTVTRTGTTDVGSGSTLNDLLASKAWSVHEHAATDITGLQALLDGKANTSHAHVISDITGLQTELNDRAYASHTHTITAVSGLQTALDEKVSKAGDSMSGTLTTPQIVLFNGGQISTGSSVDLHVGNQGIRMGAAFSGTPSVSYSITAARGTSTDSSLVWDETDDRWKFNNAGSLYPMAVTLNDLDDVQGLPSVGQVLGWSGSTWEPVSLPGALTYTLDDLTDVNATTPTAGQLLSFDGTEWVAASIPTSALNDLSDVSGTPTIGDVLTFSSDGWAPAPLPSPTYALNDLTDVSGTPTSGQVLSYFTGLGWIPAAPPGLTLEVKSSTGEGNTFYSAGILAFQNFDVQQFNTTGVSVTQQTIEFLDAADAAVSVYPNHNNLQKPLHVKFGDGLMVAVAPQDAFSAATITVTAAAVKPLPMTITSFSTGLLFGDSEHHNTSFRCTASGAAVVITVENDSNWTSPMPIGGTAIFGKHGTANVEFQAAVGVTINYPDTLILSKLHGKATLIKVGPNEYDLEGHLDPAP